VFNIIAGFYMKILTQHSAPKLTQNAEKLNAVPLWKYDVITKIF